MSPAQVLTEPPVVPAGPAASREPVARAGEDARLRALADGIARLDPLANRDLEATLCALAARVTGARHVVLEIAHADGPPRVVASEDARHALATLGDLVGPIRNALREGGPLHLRRLSDFGADGAEEPAATGPALASESFIGLAVLAGGEVAGFLYLLGKDGGFAAGDLVLAELVAAYAGQAIANARLAGQALARGIRLAAETERFVTAKYLRGRLVSLISHGLRTPLTSIIGYLDLMLDGSAGGLTVDQRCYLKTIESNSERLLEIIDELLLVAQLEAGADWLRPSPVNVADLVREAVESAKVDAGRRGTTIRASVPPLPTVRGDRGLLADLLESLVANALRYTPEGGSVEVRAHATPSQLAIEVQDTGMGIPAAEQRRVFDLFFRSPRAIEARVPGLGIGLYKVRKIAEAHRGRVSVESEDGLGALFRVELPLATPQEPRRRRSDRR